MELHAFPSKPGTIIQKIVFGSSPVALWTIAAPPYPSSRISAAAQRRRVHSSMSVLRALYVLAMLCSKSMGEAMVMETMLSYQLNIRKLFLDRPSVMVYRRPLLVRCMHRTDRPVGPAGWSPAMPQSLHRQARSDHHLSLRRARKPAGDRASRT